MNLRIVIEKEEFTVYINRLPRRLSSLLLMALAGFAITGCYPGGHLNRFEHPPQVGTNPSLVVTLAPTYTPTAEAAATALPTETSTEVSAAAPTETGTPFPTATSTVAPAEAATQPTVATPATATATRQPPTATSRARPTAIATPKPTPIVVIPTGFTKQIDSVRAYSLALPRGYTLLDLRSAQFRNLANAVGMGGQMATLNEFLDSPGGQMVGILAASDVASMIFGGLPTIAQVMVVNAAGANQDTAQDSVEGLLTGQGSFLTNPVIGAMENATINNLPGVRATVTGNLAGANRPMAGKVVGLLANDKFYVLIQLTEAGKWTTKEPIFDQIIGTFRPE